MIPDTRLEELILDQKEVFLSRDPGTTRQLDFEHYLSHEQIVVISGIRRSGKSTLMRQFAGRFPDFYYINFDDERLIDFGLDDFSRLMVVFQKIHPDVRVIFIDEIQNIDGWERFVRRIHDEGYKIFLTGSNARLLGSELATHLTGRYVKIELYPFSFAELLAFRQIEYGTVSSSKKAEILAVFDEYLEHGGFPEFIRYQDREFLQRTYDDILFRDIITRFGIREVKAFKQLVQYLFANLASEASYNALKKTLGFKSSMSVRSYIGFVEESYLLFECFRYDRSLKKQFANPKKIYVIDTGMRNAVAFRFSEDSGRLLENLVFIELKRRTTDVYYLRGKRECDFVIRNSGVITSAIQVCYELNGTNREREIGGLVEAMTDLGLEEGIILTYSQDETIPVENSRTITVMPVWRWLLGKV
jgi:uncharacterized protein